MPPATRRSCSSRCRSQASRYGTASAPNPARAKTSSRSTAPAYAGAGAGSAWRARKKARRDLRLSQRSLVPEGWQPVINEAELRRMSRRERTRMMHSLTTIDSPRLSSPGIKRRRQLFLIGLIVCCVVLAVQIGVLAWTLPRYYRTGNWRGAWVGFDVALFCTFAVTAWASWRGRQLLIMCLIVLATLLTADAWF